MNKWLELILGLILIIVPIIIAWFSPMWWGDFWNFRAAAWEFLKGGVFWFLVMIGVLFILLGISDLKG
jgi:TRAP-type C4-dicarboxylate transport system permease small subunit